MIRQELIPLAAPDAWREALRDVPHEVWHTWEHCAALALTVPHEIFLYRYEAGPVRVVAPLLERRLGPHVDIATLPGFAGFVATSGDPDFPRHWEGFARDRGYVCGYLGLHPFLGDPLDFDPLEGSNSVYVLDLRRGPDALFAALDRNRRRQLKDWEQTSAGLLRDRDELTGFLVREYPAFLERIGASSAYRRSPETLERLCNLENVLLVGAGEGGEVEAVHVFAWTPHAGTSLFSVSRPEGRRYTTTLLWQGVQELVARGVPLLNLGGGVREDDGVARAKQRFGAARLPLRCSKQVYQPEVYTELCRGHAANGYFPAYWS
ncbi:MAG TPA: hypothetical protein VHC97_04635 [Thermoanaerobaculia bacterium]|jgi:hypothetical protein|nr:hypothetical protein [Thermoanaerobaculia bacterium]